MRSERANKITGANGGGALRLHAARLVAAVAQFWRWPEAKTA